MNGAELYQIFNQQGALSADELQALIEWLTQEIEFARLMDGERRVKMLEFDKLAVEMALFVMPVVR